MSSAAEADQVCIEPSSGEVEISAVRHRRVRRATLVVVAVVVAIVIAAVLAAVTGLGWRLGLGSGTGPRIGAADQATAAAASDGSARATPGASAAPYEWRSEPPGRQEHPGEGNAGSGELRLRPADGAAIQDLLARRSRAVRAGDTAAFLATVDPSAREHETVRMAALRQLPWQDFAYELRDADSIGTSDAHIDRWVLRATQRWAIAGVDTRPVASPRRLEATRDRTAGPGGWRIRVDIPADHRDLIWDLGVPITTSTGPAGVVVELGTAQRLPANATGWQDRLAAARAAVSLAWGAASPVPLLVLPATREQLGQLLGRDPAAVTGLAAITTDEAGTSPGAPRIWIEPVGWHTLSGLAQNIVLRHEITHVATRSATSRTVPLWLQEGFADVVGYQGTGIAASVVASNLRAVATDPAGAQSPLGLPAAAQFDAPTTRDRSYEGAWLFCRQIADRFGMATLTAFYRRVATPTRNEPTASAAADVRRTRGDLDGHGAAPPAEPGFGSTTETGRVDAALRATTGAGLPAWLSRWRTAIERL